MDHSEKEKRDVDSGDGSDGDSDQQHSPSQSAAENVLSTETYLLCTTYGNDCQIVSDPFPQVTIKFRPFSGSKHPEVFVTLLISCFRGYPSKCPALMITSTEEALSKDDTDNLLSQLQALANAHALEGRPMLHKLALVTQIALHDIAARTSYRISRYLEDFKEIERLGSGGFGHVVLSTNKLDERQYAIKKILLKDKSLKDVILREAVALARLQHQHVVRYYQAWFETGVSCPFAVITSGSVTPVNSNFGDKSAILVDMSMHKNELEPMRVATRSFSGKGASSSGRSMHENEPDRMAPDTSSSSDKGASSSGRSMHENEPETTYLCIQMERCKSTLYDMLDNSYKFNEELAWRLFGQIVEGLAHIHEEGVIHRDLTPRNIFLDDHDDVKIADFGLAELSDEFSGVTPDTPVDCADPGVTLEASEDVDGTSFYVAPEIKKQSNIDEKVDIYSLGVIFFELWHPFVTQMHRRKTLGILKKEGEPPSSWVAEYPEQASLLKQLISWSPADRPSAAEILHRPFPPQMRSELLYSL